MPTNNSPTVAVGDLVQFMPEHHWAGAIAVVTETHPWGIQGYVTVPQRGAAYIRATHDEIERVGRAALTLVEPGDETE